VLPRADRLPTRVEQSSTSIERRRLPRETGGAGCAPLPQARSLCRIDPGACCIIETRSPFYREGCRIVL